MEEVQSEVLETDDLESQEESRLYAVLEFSASQKSAENKKMQSFSFQNYSKLKFRRMSVLMKKIQPVAAERKSSNTKKLDFYLNFLANSDYQSLKERMGIKDEDTEYASMKTQLIIETLKEKILTVAALREAEFEYQDESEEGSVFGKFGRSGFR